MNRTVRITAASVALLACSTALAAERTVTLAVDKMTCATCPYIVKKALTGLPGVKRAEVSFEERSASVTFDDAVTSPTALTTATADAGFPSRLVEK